MKNVARPFLTHTPAPKHQPALFCLALATTCATFPLIFMGGLVTSHGAGLSVPDWPNSYGYNMFTFPPSKWVGGILYEHTHRLMATVVGVLSIALAICAWKLEFRRRARCSRIAFSAG
jgi:cytochrome c oxidase assembly protein subunit 15